MLLLGGLTCWTGFSWPMKVLFSGLLTKTKRSIHWLIHVIDGISTKVTVTFKNNWVDRKVIMQFLFPAAFIVQQIVLVPVHWFLARKSYIFNKNEGKLPFFTTKKRFCSSFFYFYTFLLLSKTTTSTTRFQLFLLLLHLHIIDRISTPHLPFIYLSLQRSYIGPGSLIQEKALGAKVSNLGHVPNILHTARTYA